MQTAIEEIGLIKNKNNEVYIKKIKEARKLKIKTKKEYEMAVRIKNPEQIKNKLDQYKKHQMDLTNIIKDYEIKAKDLTTSIIAIEPTQQSFGI